MSSLRLVNVKKHFGKVDVIKGIDLEIQSGEFIVFVGPSGCGKSTLLRLIAGLEQIDSGDLYLNDKRVNDLSPKDRGVGMVFQSYALYPHMSVEENISFGLRLSKANDVKDRVLEVAEFLGLSHLLNRKPKELSGGQRQRVAIGRAISRHPTLMLFDEPLSNLDAALRVLMRTQLADLHRRLSSTMIYVTHDQVEAMTLADRIVVLKDGLIEQVDSPRNIYKKPRNIFVGRFIGSPCMNIFNVTLIESGSDYCVVDFPGFGDLKIPVKISSDLGGTLQIGIRPEHISLTSDSDNFEIFNTEYLGTHSYIFLRGFGFEFVVTCDVDHGFVVSNKVGILLDPNNLHVFKDGFLI